MPSPKLDQTTPMGAALLPGGGATVRVWAPRAQSVALVTGNALDQLGAAGFSPDPATQLERLGDGTWAGFWPQASDGAPYIFYVQGPPNGTAGPKRDPRARELTTTPAFPGCRCVALDPAAFPWAAGNWRTPPYPQFVIYQLHIGTWSATDAAGQDARSARRGRFLDAALKLDYLRDLGVSAIQLLPIQEYDTPYSAGYNGVDYFSPEGDYQAVDPADLDRYLVAVNARRGKFGAAPLTREQLAPGVNQLKCLIDLAHLEGIAVIFDLVYNHAGGGFDPASLAYFDRLPEGDFADSLYFTRQGWSGGQVFNFTDANVRQFLIDNARFFVDEYRIDGIRYDEVRVISDNQPFGAELCRDMTDTLRFGAPSLYQIAEYWDWDRANPVTPTPQGLGFDAALGDGLRDALRGLLVEASGGENAALNLDPVAAAFRLPYGYDHPWRMVQCLENQDLTYVDHEKDGAARVARLADPTNPQSWYARSRSRAATALLFAAPGVPALFMGQEFLEDKLWADDDKDHPGHLIWWDGLASDPPRADFLRFMQDLIALRRREPALSGEGTAVTRVNSYDRVLVVQRWVADGGPGQDVVAVVSFDEQPKFGYLVGLPRAGVWRELFNSDVYDGNLNPAPVGNGGAVVADGPAVDGFGQSARLTIPANGALFLKAA